MSWMTQRVEDLGGREKRSIARGLEIADDGITGVFERRLERKLQGVLDRRKDSKIEAQHPGYQAACELEQQINQAVASDAIAATFELDGCAVVNANISEPSPSTTRIVQIAIGNAWGKQVIFPFICEIDRFDQSLSSVADAIGIYSAVVKSRMINQSQPQAAEALKSRLDLAASTESGRFLSEDGTINVGVEGRMLEPSLDWQAMQS